MPHGYCYMWDPWIVWLHVIAIRCYVRIHSYIYCYRRRGRLKEVIIFAVSAGLSEVSLSISNGKTSTFKGGTLDH